MFSQRSQPALLVILMTLITSTLAIDNNQTMIDGPLFDKYQFLSPGIMMAGTVGFVLFGMLYVGISALASLEVTYHAFEKESGPGKSKQQ